MPLARATTRVPHGRQVKDIIQRTALLGPAPGYPQGVPLPYTSLLAALADEEWSSEGRHGVGADA